MYGTPVVTMLCSLDWLLSVNVLITRCTLVFIYKLKNGLLPQCFENFNIRYDHAMTQYVLQSYGELYVRRVRTTTSQRSTWYDRIILINDFPRDIEGSLRCF